MGACIVAVVVPIGKSVHKARNISSSVWSIEVRFMFDKTSTSTCLIITSAEDELRIRVVV